jgi:hypothetical protein
MPIPADTLHRIRTNDPSFTAVRLSHPGDVSTALTDEDIGILVDALQDNTHVTYVCLTNNNITDIGATQLRRLPQTVRTLDIGCNAKISANGATALVSGTKLEGLGIHYTGIKEPADQRPALLQAFNGNGTLTSVNVLFNGLDDTPVSIIQGHVFRNADAKIASHVRDAKAAKDEVTRLEKVAQDLQAEKAQSQAAFERRLRDAEAAEHGRINALQQNLDGATAGLGAAQLQIRQQQEAFQREKENLETAARAASEKAARDAEQIADLRKQLDTMKQNPSPSSFSVSSSPNNAPSSTVAALATHSALYSPPANPTPSAPTDAVAATTGEQRASAGNVAAPVTAAVKAELFTNKTEDKRIIGGNSNDTHQTNCCTNIKCVLL